MSLPILKQIKSSYTEYIELLLSEKLMKEHLTLPIIGEMRSPFVEKFGIPRQPNLVDVQAYIVLRPPYDDERAFMGISQFSHLWLLWHFHENKNQENSKIFRAMIRPPRLGGNQKIGVFASRSMYRPSPIGLSVVKFVKLQRVDNELRLYVQGADLLNGTPIVDIKPYLVYSDAIVEAESGYAQTAPVHLTVYWHHDARQQCDDLIQKQKMSLKNRDEIEQVLSQDPRPAYQDDAEKIYGWAFRDLNIRFKIQQNQVQIIDIQLKNVNEKIE